MTVLLGSLLWLMPGAALGVEAKPVDEAFKRGDAFLDKGRLDEAIAAFTKAIHLKPDYAAAYAIRGSICFYGMGDFDKTIADCNEAIRLNPKLVLAYLGRGLAYNGKGETAKAEADFAKARKLGWKKGQRGQRKAGVFDL